MELQLIAYPPWLHKRISVARGKNMRRSSVTICPLTRWARNCANQKSEQTPLASPWSCSERVSFPLQFSFHLSTTQRYRNSQEANAQKVGGCEPWCRAFWKVWSSWGGQDRVEGGHPWKNTVAFQAVNFSFPSVIATQNKADYTSEMLEFKIQEK